MVPRRAADDVMHEMRQVPVGHEQAEQSAVEQRIAVKVGKTFPRNDRLQRRRLVIGDEPLVDGEIGYAQQPDLARAPPLRRRPFDRIIEVDRLRERPRLALAGGFAAAASINAHRRIALGHPPLRVDRLPVHQRVRFFLEIARRNPQLVLLIRTQIQDCGKRPGSIGSKHIGFEIGAVAHGHVDVLLDDDAVVERAGRRLHLHCRSFPLPARFNPAARSSPRR